MTEDEAKAQQGMLNLAIGLLLEQVPPSSPRDDTIEAHLEEWHIRVTAIENYLRRWWQMPHAS